MAIEQHRQRFPLGFGIDEDTALVFNQQTNQFSAIANGAVVNPVNSGVFSRNSRLKDFITFDLIDNKAADTAISYLHREPGMGFELKFSKVQLSNGYWQYLDGLKDNSSAANIRLDIKPVQIHIE